jgi:undecaprenyl-diphosphatase
MTYTTNQLSLKFFSLPRLYKYSYYFKSKIIPILADYELQTVHFFSLTARPLLLKHSAIAISKLGNGYIYIILAALAFYYAGNNSLPIILLGMINAIILHVLYPIIKKKFGRRRPFIVDIQLPSLLKTLDDHSFPSGHAMTLTGVLTPIVIVWPSVSYSALVLIISMAWSRIATAHHFPSDVIAGISIGICIAYPMSSYALNLVS